MLAECNTTLAWRCPFCGELELNEINIFNFSGKDKIEVKCSCGFTKLVIIKINYKQYCLEYPCIICESSHRISYTHSELWSKQVKEIICLENGAELGYLGVYKEIERLAELEEEYLKLMADKLEFEDYFTNPEIMLSVLNELHDIVESNGLVCQCGNKDIDIDMLPKEIRLACVNCAGVTKVSAEKNEDLAFLRKLRKVKILKGTVTPLERINF